MLSIWLLPISTGEYDIDIGIGPLSYNQTQFKQQQILMTTFFPQDCVEKHQTMTNSGRRELKMTIYKSIAVNDKLRLQRIG